MPLAVLRRGQSEFAKRRPRPRDTAARALSDSATTSEMVTPAPRSLRRHFALSRQSGSPSITLKKASPRPPPDAAAADPDDLPTHTTSKAAAYTAAADAAARRGLFEKAERYLRAALRQYGRVAQGAPHGIEITECLTLLGIALERAGKPVLAEKALRDCIAHAPRESKSAVSDVAKFALAGILERTGRFNEAEPIRRQLARLTVPYVHY